MESIPLVLERTAAGGGVAHAGRGAAPVERSCALGGSGRAVAAMRGKCRELLRLARAAALRAAHLVGLRQHQLLVPSLALVADVFVDGHRQSVVYSR